MVQKKSTIKSEIIHMKREELCKVSVPVTPDIRSLEILASQIQKISHVTEPTRCLKTERVSKATNTMRSITVNHKESPFFSTFE